MKQTYRRCTPIGRDEGRHCRPAKNRPIHLDRSEIAPGCEAGTHDAYSLVGTEQCGRRRTGKDVEQQRHLNQPATANHGVDQAGEKCTGAQHRELGQHDPHPRCFT